MSTPTAPLQERSSYGISLVLCGYLLLTSLDSSAKWLGMIGLPALEVIFIRYFVHFLMVLATSLPRQRAAIVRSNNLKIELLRAATLVGSTLCNFTAVRYLPITVTGAIGFTGPMIISVLSVLLFREQVGWRRWTAIAVGFAGILIIIRPGTETFSPATLLSFAGITLYCLYALCTRILAGVDPPGTQQFYAAGVATAVLLPVAFLAWQWPATAIDWAVFLGIGMFGFAGHQLVTIAHRFAPASTLAPFAYVQILIIALYSAVFFRQPPDQWFLLGAPVVIGSGLYIWWRERRLGRGEAGTALAADAAEPRPARG